MNIFSKIKQNNHFTNTEKIVVDYILEYPEEVLELDIKAFTKKCYVSLSTVYRVIDKLELQGFSQLKLLISSQLNDYQDEKKQIDYNYPFKENDTHYQIASKMSTLYEQTISSTKNLIDLDVFTQVVSSLEKANHIMLFPSAGNINIAKNFQFHMTEIGKHVDVETLPYIQYMSALALKKGDVAIVISYANRATGMVDIIQELKKQGVCIVLISSTLPNDLFSYATYHLFCCPYKIVVKKLLHLHLWYHCSIY